MRTSSRAVPRRMDPVQTRSLHTASIGNRSARPSASGRINPGRRARVERTRRFDQPSSSNLCNRCTACTASPEGQTCTAIRRGSAVNRESATRSAVAPERLLREHGRLDLADLDRVAEDFHVVLLGSVRRSMRDGTRPSRKFLAGHLSVAPLDAVWQTLSEPPRPGGQYDVARHWGWPARAYGQWAARRACLDEWGRDEQELVRRCKEGSEAAYAVLVRLHRPRLYTLAYRLLLDRESAEDVVQETFIAAFRQMERFEPRPSLAAWLNTIALRTATRAASRQRARPKTSIDAPAFRDNGNGAEWSRDHLAFGGLADTSPSTDPIAAAEAAELRRALAAAIVELPFKYRAAVVLRHVMGLDYGEAARALDLPLNTFKSHLLRGTKLLREGLAPDLDAPRPATSGSNGRHLVEADDGDRISDLSLI